MRTPVPVVSLGLGPIGTRILSGAARDPLLRVIGAVDVNPALVGRPLSELAPGAPEGLVVRRSLTEIEALPCAVVLQATGSWVPDVAPQLREALGLGLHVVSTCEELVWPYARHPELADEIDRRAVAAGCTVVATGVNPGFIMDAFVVGLSAASHDIRSITVHRVIDPRVRRVQFQQKVGLGIPRAEYEARLAGGKFGHVGLRESAQMAAAGLGWPIAEWQETLDPVQPDPAGLVLGLVQTVTGQAAGRSLELRFEAHGLVAESYDLVVVDGTPPVRVRFEGGLFGDDATAAAVLHAARVMPSAPRGLVTVLDLPLRAR